jgi:hypothetical protein
MRRIILLPLLLLFCAGCSSNNNTSSPGTIKVDYPFIGAFTYEHSGSMDGQVFLTDTNGPVTNAGVTFSYTGGSTPATYVGNVTEPVTINGFVLVSLVTAHYMAPAFASDPAGTNCQIMVHCPSGNYHAVVMTVGNATFSPGGSGITCLWDGGGNSNSVEYCNGGCVTLGMSVSSPYYVPQSSLPGYTPGTFSIVSNMENDGPYGNLSTESYFNSYAEADTIY